MFEVINKDLRQLKDGIINILTNKSLTSPQKQMILNKRYEIDHSFETFKNINCFILYENLNHDLLKPSNSN